MNKLYRFFIYTVATLIVAALSPDRSLAQLVGDNTYLQGQYLEVGIAPNGSLGTTRNAPSGYHSNAPAFNLYDPLAGSSVTSTAGHGGALAQVYDQGHDGWTTGTPAYFGDYTLPGTPYEGWGVEVNGTHSEAQFQFYNSFGAVTGFSGGTLTGTASSYTNSGGRMFATWTGTAVSGQLAITQKVELDTTASWVLFTVTLKNTGGTTLTNVYYERECDPDNDSYTGGSSTTSNNIDYQNDYANRVQVTAAGTHYTTQTLSLLTKDCRAKCYIAPSWPISSAASLATLYSGASGYVYSGSDVGDYGIGIVWNLGSIAAGDSTIIYYAYGFDGLYGIDSAIASPQLVTLGVAHDTTDTVTSCSFTGDTLHATIINGDTANWTGSTWTWSPAASLTATTGLSSGVIMTGITGLTTYTITGTTTSVYGSCATKTFLLTVTPASAPPTPTVRDTSYCLGATAVPLTAVGTGVLWYTSATGGTGSTTAPTPSTSTVGTTTYWASQTIAGCLSARVPVHVTIVPLPGTITGPSAVCVGSAITEADTAAGGHWTSSATSIATVGSGTGIVTGVASGTTTISYTVSSGCSQTRIITVNPLPSPIGGITTVCAGATTTLSDPALGGTWSSSNTGIATVGTSSGIVTGVTAGTATITYTLGTGCYTTTTVSVSPSPSAISGPSGVCIGFTTTLTDATPGGVWSSTYPGIASVGSSSGVVTGLTVGTTTISYTQAGCSATKSFTVYPLPGPVTGIPFVCIGQTTTLFDVGGGTWTSSNTSIATVGSSTGVVTGVAAGAATITYTLSTGCYTTFGISVYPLPGVITGTRSVCIGSTTTLADTASGIWSSSDPGIAFIDPGTGVVTGVAAGTATISYTGSTGCATTTTFTVNASPALITGIPSVCVGSSVPLLNTTLGGTWSSSNPSVATVGSASGILTGISTGHAIIDYTLPTGCYSAVIATVNPNPVPVSGSSSVCIGFSATLTDGTPGGTWSSSSTGVATIGSSSGVMTGVSAGTATITYRLATGCYTTYPVTVNSSPGTISGPNHVCIGSTILLTDAGGGTWGSSNTAVATVGSSTGVVTGVAAGIATITYTVGVGCFSTLPITVNSLPAGITGPTSVCMGASITLADGTTGGTWSTSGSNVTVGSATGVVTGVSVGSAVVSYSIASGCARTTTVNVNPVPPAFTVTGGGAYCSGGTGSHIGLSGSTGGVNYQLYLGGVPSGTPVAGTGSALDFGVRTTAGTYTVVATSASTGCTNAMTGSATITINPLPPLCTVTGGGSYCSGGAGLHIDLSCSSTGVSYQLMNSGVPVGSPLTGTGGVLDFGLQTAAGTYTVVATDVTTGCTRTMSGSATITITPPPTPIVGPTAVCVGSSIVLSSTPGGGTWISGNPAVATINPATGVLTGVSIGVAPITYTSTAGCRAFTSVTVSLSPTAITGPSGVCVGSSDTLTDTVAGGVWTSSASSIASIGSLSGIVTGVSIGTATITYSLGSGCTRTRTISVGPAPASITGPSSVCIGSTITLSDATPGGSWSSGASGTASVSGSGIVSGVSSGVATISYTAAGCAVTKPVTVNPTPLVIGGPSSVCVASSITLTDGVPGGTWSSTSATVTVGSSTGIVTGVSSGSAIITYAIGTCITTKLLTVNTTAPITGALGICVGASTTLSDAIGGGTWSSSSTGVATIGATTGVVTGVAAGTSVITYAIPGGCFVTATVTVNLAPTVITGPHEICAGTTATLTDTAGGGLWTSSSTGVAIIGSTSGVVTGVTAGTTNITYSLGGLCRIFAAVTVDPIPAAISGTTHACAGASITLSDATPGGTWSEGPAYTTIASVGSSSGLVTGISGGVAMITYSLPTGCFRTVPVTINPIPAAIGGPASVCQGLTTTLTDATPGGSWSSGATSIATVGASSGVVTGVGPGTALITYSIGGCNALVTVTVTPAPSPIIGPANVCVGSTIALSDTVLGGIWTSSIPAMATVGASSGIVTGVSSGTVIISYAIGTDCAKAATVIVNPISPILGTPVVCVGQTTHLADTTLGGAWSSSATGIAIVNASGVVTGVAAGTATIDYTLATGCIASIVVTVNPLPSPITGPSSVCVGQVIPLADASPLGTWGSSNPAVATVDGVGIVSGVTPGIDTISYTFTGSTGCAATKAVTVNPVPFAIAGPNAVCIGGHITLYDPTPGGTWSSSNPAIGSVNALTGVVSGITAGSVTISYTTGSSCFSVKTISVVSPPPAPTGSPLSICQGQSVTLTDAAGAGIWNSSNVSVASVGSTTGVVTGGILPGTAAITFSVLSGCPSSPVIVTVNALPAAISGPSVLCVGQTATFTDAYTGSASWSSSDTTVATISASGLATAIAPGTAIITFTTAAGCSTTAILTVGASPAPIVGSNTVCLGTTTTMTDATTGGVWSSSAASIASVDAMGDVTGAALGTAIISYSTGTACPSVKTVTVTPFPSAIAGSANVCAGQTTTLTDAVGGGEWSSSNTAIATVGSSSGIVTGITAGSATIIYSLGTSCSVTLDVTVNAGPAAITGPNNVCQGQAITLSDAVPGGTWSSSNPSTGSVDTYGDVTGVASGTTTISYTDGFGCFVTYLVTVNTSPAPITGSTNVCLGGTATLHDAVPGGTWTSYNTAVATVGSGTGVVSGRSLGSATIVYELPGACFVSTVVNVFPLPAVYNVTGGGSHCLGDSGVHIGLSNSALGVNYMLYNGPTAVGAFPGSGGPLDFGLHTVTGTYTVIGTSTASGCSVTMAGSASVSPIASVIPSVTLNVAPGDTVCAGTSVTFTPVPVNGGTSPVYEWSVNAHPVSLGASYSYIPADHDTVKVTLTSNATCALPATASHSVIMTVQPFVNPSVSISAVPGDTVCKGSPITLNAVTEYGGTTPVYEWYKNGAPSGSSASFTYIPNNGDVVDVVLHSSYACRLSSADTSAPLAITVDTLVYPIVSISAHPGFVVGIGEPDTLTAVAPAAIAPTYQWYINGIPVPGATNATYVGASFSHTHEDSVSVAVTSHGICPVTTHQWIYIIVSSVGVPQVTTGSDLNVLPNPNKGTFTVKGSLGTMVDEEVTIELTDMIGQVVYKNKVVAKNGKLDEHIQLSGSLANGMYMLSVRSGSETKIFHLAIEQ